MKRERDVVSVAVNIAPADWRNNNGLEAGRLRRRVFCCRFDPDPVWLCDLSLIKASEG